MASQPTRNKSSKSKVIPSGKPYTVVEPGDRSHARIRFPGVYQKKEIVWDATVYSLHARARAAAKRDPVQYIDIGQPGPHGIRLTVGLNVEMIDEPTLLKTVIMIQNYKRLRPGRHEFGAATARPKAPTPFRLEKIISGGQTGVDRAALDAAMAAGLACGGWCPRDRRAEDGVIPRRYPLTETDTRDYRQRTARNVHEADATLILTRGPLRGGTALTRHLAVQADKPCLVVDLAREPDPERVRDWIGQQRLRTLNVAGPRESQQPGIHLQARWFLRRVIQSLGARRSK